MQALSRIFADWRIVSPEALLILLALLLLLLLFAARVRAGWVYTLRKIAAFEAIKQAVVDDVTRFIGQQKVYDDLTLVVLKQK